MGEQRLDSSAERLADAQGTPDAGTDAAARGELLQEKLAEAEMRLRLIAEMQTVDDGKYVLTAGRVMTHIAAEYFRMFADDVPVCPLPLTTTQRRDWRLLHAHKR